MRKINELDLKVTYITNHDLVLALKMLPSLAFEKQVKIGESYDMIVQETQNVCDRNCLEPEKNGGLCLYFGSTYTKSMLPKEDVAKPGSFIPTLPLEPAR